MYSPKISPLLIPDLYWLAKSQGVPMTKLVNRMLVTEIKKQKKKGEKNERDIDAQRR